MLIVALSTGTALAAGLLAGIGSEASAAAGTWRTRLPDVAAQQVLTAPDGTTVVGDCSTSSPQFKTATINSSGDLVSRVPTEPDRPGICDASTARGRDGAVYTLIGRSGTEMIAAYRGGEQPAWVTPFPCRSPENPLLGVAGDGNVYTSYRCSGQERGLRRLDASTGSVTMESATGARETGPRGFQPYATGIAILDAGPDPAVRFVGLDGVTRSITPLPRENGGGLYDMSASHDGRAIVRFFANRQVTDDCQYSQVVTRIVAVDADAPSAPLRWDHPPCSAVGPLASTPDRGVLAGWIDGGGAGHLLRLDAGLSRPLWGYDIPATTAGRRVLPRTVGATVDGTGRVLVSIQLDKPQEDADVLFVPLDPAGAPGPTIDTDAIDPQARFDQGLSRPGITPGGLSVLGRDCRDYGYYCTGPSVAYGFPLSGFTLDYPRSAILGAAPTPAPACGDAAVLGMRGSGDNSRGDTWPGDQARAVADRLQSRHGLTLLRGGAIGVRYPAVSVELKDLRPDNLPYGDSKRAGTSALQEEIAAVHRQCGASFPVFVVGFSQGAHAIQDALGSRRLAADTTAVTGAVLLASPRFDGGDSTARGTFARDASSVAKAPGGALGGERVSARFSAVTRSYCRSGDPVCALTPWNVNPAGPGFHIGGYVPGSPNAERILDDAAAFLDWTARATTHRPPKAAPGIDPIGEMEAFTTSYPTTNRLSLLRTVVSAAAYYPRGVPSVRFDWDTDGDGRYDQVTTTAWTASAPRLVRTDQSTRGPELTTSVRIRFADGTTTTIRACVRPDRAGAASRC